MAMWCSSRGGIFYLVLINRVAYSILMSVTNPRLCYGMSIVVDILLYIEIITSQSVSVY